MPKINFIAVRKECLFFLFNYGAGLDEQRNGRLSLSTPKLFVLKSALQQTDGPLHGAQAKNCTLSGCRRNTNVNYVGNKQSPEQTIGRINV